ncbi:YfjI family protein [Nocardia brasiliensis]|uniref:YfjI family protein n=1 Tax=Nocardia brasiliensis TaxID=37326 RepID=UPI0006925D61|nr:YfjI family protein [Nocardia brasiliensis]
MNKQHDSTADADDRAEPCPWVPQPMAADLLGVDLMNPPPGLHLDTASPYDGPGSGLVRAASLATYGKRPPTWAQVDAWYAERGLPNEARAKQEHETKAAAKRAEDTVEREREEQRKRDAENRPPTADDIRAMFDGDPVPLGANSTALPAFPVDALPSPYAEMVAAVSTALQVGTGMAGPVALAVLAAACAGCVEAEPRPGWEEITALHVLVAARPSERKSALIAALSRPLVDAEDNLVAAVAARRTEALTRQDIARKRAEQAAKDAAKGHPAPTEDTPLDEPRDPLDGPRDPVARAVALAKAAEEIDVPGLPRLLADDVTPEALGSLLAEHRGRIAIMSAEGGVFETLAGRYSNKVPSLDIWLKGYSGDPIRVDRKGRPAELIDRPALTVCLMLQPQVLGAIGHNRDFRGRGLLARALFALPPSLLGHRDHEAPPVPERVASAYAAALSSLARTLHTLDGDDDGPVSVKFDADASRAVVTMLGEVETRLVDPNDLGGDLEAWGGKYVGNVVRIALLLHMAEHGAAGVTGAVTAASVDAARRIGEFFAAHSAAALGSVSASGDVSDAETVLGKLRELHAAAPLQPVVRRDLGRVMPRNLRKVSELDAALDVLAEHNLIVRSSTKVGGATKVAIYLHPDAA